MKPNKRYQQLDNLYYDLNLHDPLAILGISAVAYGTKEYKRQLAQTFEDAIDMLDGQLDTFDYIDDPEIIDKLLKMYTAILKELAK